MKNLASVSPPVNNLLKDLFPKRCPFPLVKLAEQYEEVCGWRRTMGEPLPPCPPDLLKLQRYSHLRDTPKPRYNPKESYYTHEKHWKRYAALKCNLTEPQMDTLFPRILERLGFQLGKPYYVRIEYLKIWKYEAKKYLQKIHVYKHLSREASFGQAHGNKTDRFIIDLDAKNQTALASLQDRSSSVGDCFGSDRIKIRSSMSGGTHDIFLLDKFYDLKDVRSTIEKRLLSFGIPLKNGSVEILPARPTINVRIPLGRGSCVLDAVDLGQCNDPPGEQLRQLLNASVKPLSFWEVPRPYQHSEIGRGVPPTSPSPRREPTGDRYASLTPDQREGSEGCRAYPRPISEKAGHGGWDRQMRSVWERGSDEGERWTQFGSLVWTLVVRCHLSDEEVRDYLVSWLWGVSHRCEKYRERGGKEHQLRELPGLLKRLRSRLSAGGLVLSRVRMSLPPIHAPETNEDTPSALPEGVTLPKMFPAYTSLVRGLQRTGGDWRQKARALVVVPGLLEVPERIRDRVLVLSGIVSTGSDWVGVSSVALRNLAGVHPYDSETIQWVGEFSPSPTPYRVLLGAMVKLGILTPAEKYKKGVHANMFRVNQDLLSPKVDTTVVDVISTSKPLATLENFVDHSLLGKTHRPQSYTECNMSVLLDIRTPESPKISVNSALLTPMTDSMVSEEIPDDGISSTEGVGVREFARNHHFGDPNRSTRPGLAIEDPVEVQLSQEDEDLARMLEMAGLHMAQKPEYAPAKPLPGVQTLRTPNEFPPLAITEAPIFPVAEEKDRQYWKNWLCQHGWESYNPEEIDKLSPSRIAILQAKADHRHLLQRLYWDPSKGVQERSAAARLLDLNGGNVDQYWSDLLPGLPTLPEVRKPGPRALQVHIRPNEEVVEQMVRAYNYALSRTFPQGFNGQKFLGENVNKVLASRQKMAFLLAAGVAIDKAGMTCEQWAYVYADMLKHPDKPEYARKELPSITEFYPTNLIQKIHPWVRSRKDVYFPRCQNEKSARGEALKKRYAAMLRELRETTSRVPWDVEVEGVISRWFPGNSLQMEISWVLYEVQRDEEAIQQQALVGVWIWS